MQYRVVDMSNDKYIIKGITLGKNINSYFCMNKGDCIDEFIVVDGDVYSVLDGQVILSMKNVGDDYIEYMLYSFCHFFMENGYDIFNMRVNIKISDEKLKVKIEDFLKKFGVISLKEVVGKKDNLVSFDEDISKELEIQNRLFNKESDENEQSNSYVEIVSEFNMDMINENENYEVSLGTGGRVVLPMTLFLISIFLLVVSFVMFVMM